MYGYLWRLIPGPFIVKLIVTLIVAIAVFFLLMEVVFPWVSTMMPYNDVSV
ncbi:hypothetical protein [Corynebacterium argentoratense]|uniref:Membrane protein n=1 Tax=Corynebacterium argentoratense DSM 44202 TaxID=1348662 RepID=U3GX96_9CORY|nr:hypothetical protein [Corynebacterium argentoratense]AGU15974.1 membrane protein [Corynebacterium argentoratense DSM 44202]